MRSRAKRPTLARVFQRGLLLSSLLVPTPGVLGCAKGPPISVEPREDGGPPIDTDVMAYLSLARSLHHQANLAEDERDLSGAIAPLERLVRVPKPHEGAKVPEVEEVLADTYARMAEFRLRTGDASGAEKDVQKGLAHAPESTYFRGHLLEVWGVLDESRASTLADAGQADAAQLWRTKAREHFKEAVRIQEGVLASATADDARGAGGYPTDGGEKRVLEGDHKR
jgi:hypothetical protein